MFLRQVPLLMSTLGALGCADMLGLGGLTYDGDENAETLVSASGGAPEGAGGGEILPDGDGDVSPGGTGIVTDPERFSILLDRGTTLAASPLPGTFPDYFFFEPSSEELSFRRQDGYTSALIETWTWPAPDGFSHLAAVPFLGGLTLIGYDKVSGFTSQATLSAQSEFKIVSTDVGTSGRSELLAFSTAEEWLAFVYSGSDGNYRYFRPLPSDKPDVFAGSFEPGWSSISRYVVAGEPGILKHNSETGLLQFDRFVAHGEPFEKVFEVEIDETFSQMVTYGEAGVLFYSVGSGTVMTGSIEMDSELFRFQEIDRGYFRGDLTQIVPLAEIAGDFALTFSASSGRAVLRQLSPLEDVQVVVVR